MSPASFLSVRSSLLPPADVELCWPHKGEIFPRAALSLSCIYSHAEVHLVSFLSLLFRAAEPGLTHWLLPK